MKIFMVTTNVEMAEKPDWLDDFRNRYDKPYDYHITLKQPCFVADDQMSKLKPKLTSLLSKMAMREQIRLSFDTIKISNDSPGGICIMLNSSNQPIRKLQKEVANTLSDYNAYYKPEYETYEKNFEPHITIARDLTDEKYSEASKVLKQNFTCTATVSKVILTVVNNFGPEEVNNAQNQTTFDLNF